MIKVGIWIYKVKERNALNAYRKSLSANRDKTLLHLTKATIELFNSAQKRIEFNHS
jgi:hypothetical protein